MLDQLSRGRLLSVIGRGTSAVEASYYGEATYFAVRRQIFAERAGIYAGLVFAEVADLEGKHRQFKDVPIELETVQKPHPPLWYGLPTRSRARPRPRGLASMST